MLEFTLFGFVIDWWVVFGLFGQLLFGMRFITQWIMSERRGESVIPVHFWYFSVAGGILVLMYAIKQWDLVFMLGQGVALLIYMRNLMLIHGKKKNDHAEEVSA